MESIRERRFARFPRNFRLCLRNDGASTPAPAAAFAAIFRYFVKRFVHWKDRVSDPIGAK